MVFLIFIFLSVVFGQQFDFHLQENQQAHHTDGYRVTPDILVLRRAGTFSVSVVSSEPFDLQVIPIDPWEHKQIKGSSTIKIPTLSAPSGQDKWEAWTKNSRDFQVNIPSNSEIAMYAFQISTKKGVVSSGTYLVILFNAWSPNDLTYLENKDARNEYVLNEQGALFLTQTRPNGWTFDQFDQAVLEVTLFYLDVLPWTQRADVISISRHLSAIMNVNNYRIGLMEGRWREPYSDGKAPWIWDHSGEIFETYRKTRKTVKYAQCWVFSAILTSAGRTLGIPARPITNFQSAHEDPEHGFRNTIDFLNDKNGQPIGALGSIWNFHAWTEFWFNRTDLQTVGWQAVDATPQEISDGKYQLGPASQLFVKNQKLDVKYDTDFVASETNAAVRQYVQFNTGKAPHPFKKGFWLSEETINACGRDISTKAIGSNRRNDITDDYKFVKQPERNVLFHTKQNFEVDFQVTDPRESIDMGNTLYVTLSMNCPLCSPSNIRTIQAYSTISILSYVGNQIATLRNNITYLVLADSNPANFTIAVPREDYEKYLSFNEILESYFFVKVFSKSNYTGEYFSYLKRYSIEEPDLDIEVDNITSTHVTLSVKIPNPLSIPLTNVALRISSAYLVNVELPIGSILPSSSLLYGPFKIPLNPLGWPAKGYITVYAKATSDQVSNFEGNVNVIGPKFSSSVLALEN